MKAARKGKSWARFDFYVYKRSTFHTWPPFDLCAYNLRAYARENPPLSVFFVAWNTNIWVNLVQSLKTTLKREIAFEMKCYTKRLKISWTEHRANKSKWKIFIKKRELKYFGHAFKKRWGSGKHHIEGKDRSKRERERQRRQWKREVRDDFDMSLAEVGRLVVDRNCFRCAFKGATSYGDK